MEEKKKVKQVGNLTFGLLLITLGILFLISIFVGFKFLVKCYIAWPIFLVALGCEILYFGCVKNYEIKWSFWNIVVMGLTLCFAFMVCIAGAIYTEVTKDALIENKIQEELYEHLDIEQTNDISNTNE